MKKILVATVLAIVLTPVFTALASITFMHPWTGEAGFYFRNGGRETEGPEVIGWDIYVSNNNPAYPIPETGCDLTIRMDDHTYRTVTFYEHGRYGLLFPEPEAGYHEAIAVAYGQCWIWSIDLAVEESFNHGPQNITWIDLELPDKAAEAKIEALPKGQVPPAVHLDPILVPELGQ
jgi:hypothetical protein